MEIVIATSNLGKWEEIKEVAKDFGIVVRLASDLHKQGLIKIPPPKVEETAGSYAGNAKLKADALLDWGKLPTLGDDSGLEVEALGGEPGVDTAIYAGPSATDKENRDKLLAVLEGVENRNARYVCHLHLALPKREPLIHTAYFEGSIAHAALGTGGFGYDPIFIPAGESLTAAQMKERNLPLVTHRIKALKGLFLKLINS